jgi:hypothetical protein
MSLFCLSPPGERQVTTLYSDSDGILKPEGTCFRKQCKGGWPGGCDNSWCTAGTGEVLKVDHHLVAHCPRASCPPCWPGVPGLVPDLQRLGGL